MSKIVELNYHNQTLRINCRGGGIAEYYVEKDGRREDIVYGYCEESDYDGGMGDILSPFPGRVDKGEYTYNGEGYKLQGFEENNGNPLHVFVRELEWQVAKTSDNQITSTLDVLVDKFAKNGYPFGLKYQIIYTLKVGGLHIKTVVKNTDEKIAPFGIGYHPYFSVAREVDEMVWKVPAESLVEFDQNLKPTGKIIPVNETDLDFREGGKIGNKEIDNCFTGLIRDENGIFTSTLSSKDGQKVIEIWQNESYPYFQTYSADTIDENNYRKAMALEPQSCCGYAINMPELGLVDLEPGSEFRGEWGINHHII
ncbi:MAG: Aldose 1-epimerase [bacterium ADurb.Bin212]|nr:MAG: Aldose 1-epimerase [bacterium ADurb.Bin212]